MSKMDELCKKRTTVRSKITRLYGVVKAGYESWDSIEKKTQLLKANSLQSEILELDEKILSIAIGDDETEDELEVRASVAESYTDSIFSILSMLDTPTNSNDVQPPNPHSSIRSDSALKLPQVELPKFRNGKEENLGKFLNIFDSILSKYTQLTEHQKFLLVICFASVYCSVHFQLKS